jgi:hypothetical protein
MLTTLIILTTLVNLNAGAKQLREPIVIPTFPNNVYPVTRYPVAYTVLNSHITIVSIASSMMKTGGDGAILSFTIPNEYCLPSGDPRGGNVVLHADNRFVSGTFGLIQGTDPVRIEFYTFNGSTLADSDIVTRQSFQIWRGETVRM